MTGGSEVALDGKPLAGLLFDKDGTLLDFHATWGPAAAAVTTTFAAGDTTLAERIAQSIGLDLAARRLHPHSPLVSYCSADYAHLFAGPLGVASDADFLARLDALFDEASFASFTPIGDPAGVLGGLARAGYRLGIATNDTHSGAVAHAKRLKIAEHIAFYAGYDSGHGRKPGPGMVTAFADFIGAAPSRVAIVGDSVHDLESGRAAGALRIAVLSGPAPREALAPHADHVIASIAELPALLASSNRAVDAH
jgi:phosphoglycolate phosphatase